MYIKWDENKSKIKVKILNLIDANRVLEANGVESSTDNAIIHHLPLDCLN